MVKPYEEPSKLKILRSLNKRMDLSKKEKQNYIVLKKGNDGERIFASLLENLSKDWIVLNNLLLEKSNSVFQIDTLLFIKNTIYLFEVKNYSGDYYLENNIWYSATGKEIMNPLNQLVRTESLFRRFIKDLKFNPPLKSLVIFLNPEFTLFQAPLNLPIILPTQLNQFLNNLIELSEKPSVKQNRLAKLLISEHLSENPFTGRLPQYEYRQLKKGILCSQCRSFLTLLNSKILICLDCGRKESLEASVVRSIDEFSLLFPNKKITATLIQEWCDVIESKKKIRNILKKNLTLLRHGRSSHYVIKTK